MKSRHLNLFVLATLSIFWLLSCDSTSTPDEQFTSIFPTENLEAIKDLALVDGSNSALLIWQGGQLVVEEYTSADHSNFNGQSLHLIFSGSKSFAGILAGLGVKNGLFSFDTTLGELITPWDPESERGAITIRELLNLTSGIQTASVGAQQTAEEWLNAGMAYNRGSTFRYGPTPFYLLSWIFVEEFGINPIDYLDDHLFTPLGLVRGQWLNVNQQYPNLSFGGQYPALDWLQVGLMLKNFGTLNGTEILPSSIVDELLAPSDAAPGYGVTFWLNTPSASKLQFIEQVPFQQGHSVNNRLIADAAPADLFMKSGLFGQKLYIIPSMDLVIVRLGPAFGASLNDQEFFSILLRDVELP